MPNYNGAGSDADIFFKTKPIEGEWPNVTEVVSTESTENSFDPHIAIDSNHIYIVWHDSTNYNGCSSDMDIFFKKKPIYGEWPVTAEVVSTESDNDSSYASLCINSNRVYVAWNDKSDYKGAGGDIDLFFKSKLIGENWPRTTEVITSESNSDSFAQDLVVDDNYVHVTWSDFSDISGTGRDGDIYYKRKELEGAWDRTEETVSTDSNVHSTRPKIDVFGGLICITWQENAILREDDNFDFYAGEIFFSSKTLHGNWQSATEVLYADAIYGALNPSIMADFDGNFHICWYRRVKSYPTDCSDVLYIMVSPF
jgi:hypothetical protein